MTKKKLALTKTRPSDLFIISMLGVLSVISPFAIDMYLPAYLQVAKDFDVASTIIPLTISSYFIGLAGGQLFYGPLLDRFGRKKPLCAGLVIFLLASVGCADAKNITALIILRFIQALGGCGAQVASLAMVRDFFSVNQSAKILSLLFLFIAVSPLLAPSVGGFVVLTLGWRSVFYVLMGIVAIILALVFFHLPEGHIPDESISLKPASIIAEYLSIIKHPRFATYALSGAFSFSGLFAYVAGSPIIFMEGFHMTPKMYSATFAALATGFIGGSQVNVILLRKFTSQQLFRSFLTIQVIGSLVFIIGTALGLLGLFGTLVLFFICLSCAGITYPNAAAQAMAPFTKNAGSAAALLGSLQLGVGSLISSGISVSPSHTGIPTIAILALTSCIGFSILLIGGQKPHERP